MPNYLLRSWPLDPAVVGSLLATALIYARGWMQLRRRGSTRFTLRGLVCFLAGLGAIFLALASPIESFSGYLLHIHMVQHLLLMMAAPPLLWLGDPLLPLLRGLPLPVRRYWAGPLFQCQWLRALCSWLTRLPVAWSLFVGSLWLWHSPRLYETALGSPAWHFVQHLFFLGTALLFWLPVVRPFPGHWPANRWPILPYLFLADLQNTALSALLAFSGQPLYPHYAAMPRLWDISVMQDQAIAGALMWVPGSLAFIVPLAWIGCRILYGKSRPLSGKPTAARLAVGSRVPLPLLATASAPDVLRWPLIGRLLRWRHIRLAMQVPLAVIAALIIWDGLLGPQVSPMNLAGVAPWIHWRGLVVLGLLAAGNVFCMACPFLLPRNLARRRWSPRWTWPRRLRSKWLAIVLLLLFFWAYEAFALWSSPWWTAWIALAYFLAAFVIDAFFRGAAFCKYICPVGQFHFVQSRLSPLSLQVRNHETCHDCTSKDCIRGREGIPGCELNIYLPRKTGNMDCTMCLDCVHACPHDNIGLIAGTPGRDLLVETSRSGLGRLSRRLDVGVLSSLLVFAAFANAAGMVGPVLEVQDRLAMALGTPLLVKTLFVALTMVALPMMLIATANATSRWWSGETGPWLESAIRYGYALIPLGFGMWLTHYCFHLFTSAETIVPVVQRLVADWSGPWLGVPEWACCCCAAVGTWLLRLEIIFLDVGLLASLFVGYRLARARHALPAGTLKAFLPWALLMLALFAVGIWIIFQPMEMRGALEMAR
ncbi:MAG: hypothetical protein FJ271_07405 [Planctomycetes bacterium]|nr:hypothetical protein [Planctomycetota bacterium]